jgi:hypothetical protein
MTNAFSGLPKALVVLGAGASWDAWNGQSPQDKDWRPPLARELFLYRKEFWAILQRYPGARALQERSLGPLSAAPTPLDLEARLRDFAVHPDEHTKRQFKDVPPYIRDVIWEAQRGYLRGGLGSFAALVGGLLSDVKHEVVFLVLNYDTFLERALSSRDPAVQFTGPSHYTDPGRQARVVKPHGSVDWFWDLGATTKENDTWAKASEDLDAASGACSTRSLRLSDR